MATTSQWLLLTCLGFCAAWMDERPVLESRDGNLFISAARDKNITLRTLGDGQVNVNDVNLLYVAAAAESATHLIERWRTGYLAEVEANLHRLTQIVEGPEGLEKRIAMMKGFGDGNSSLQPEAATRNQSTTGMNSKIRMIAHRVRRVEEKVRTMETKLRKNECTSNPCQNGGSCQDLYEGYQCHCPSNWEGPNCVMDVNECVRLLGTDLGCQNGATCLNLPGSYRCECAPGWFGLHCNKKSSVCSTQTSDELCGHGVCVAKPGTPLGYTCICDQGWQADSPNPACIKDVDECAGNHRPCSVNPWVACRNAPGTFFCDSCPQGYTGNGYYCIDIDECLADNGGCSTSPRVQCINTMGSRMCGPCPMGYQGDGVTCTYVGNCAINNGGCHPLAVCVKNPTLPSTYVMCRCPLGMVGNGIGPEGCQPSTDVSVNALCSSNPCVNGRCIDIGQSYTCACNPGYTGATCNVKIDPCTPNPCKNNGVCVISNGVAACDCTSSYTGSRCETSRQTCGGVSRNLVGHLEFPIGGSVYQKGLSCAWVLVTNSSLVLNVTFTRFNLEQSTDCKFDFLQIHDGRNAGSQMIGRFCGNSFPHENGNIVSSHNSLYFWFHSDDSVTNDGFEFHWNSIKPVCGGSLTDDYGTISSPGSPGRYPPNRDCYWQITVRPSMRIQIHFGLLMLEEHPTCQADFLEISTIHQERLGLYCNHTHPPPLVVPASEAVVYFHSDSAGQDAGFQIHYSAIEGIPGCNDVYTAPTGTIKSPTDQNKAGALECEWKIQMPIGKRIEITWSQFDLSDLGCMTEHIEIFDGETSDSLLLDRFCGNTIPPTVRSSHNVLLIVFASKNVRKGLFSLSYKVVCGGIFSEESGVIQSPMYPQQRPNFDDDCVYEIKQPADKRIVLHLLDIDIRGLYANDCFLNYFRVFDSPRENATRLGNLCVADLDLSPDNVFYYSTHNYMMIRYKNTKGRGFLANYTTIENKCGGLYTQSGSVIQVPTTNNHYANNQDCVWTIQAPAGFVVQLKWLEFGLEQTMRCRRDYVKVYENYMTTSREELGIFCGSNKPPLIQTQGTELTLVFHSDATIYGEGFTASAFFIDSTKSCGGHFIKKVGVLQSPNYPLNYPNKKICEWVIEAPNKQRVILNVKHFKLEQHSSCFFDYLEIRNGGYSTSPLIGKYCGTTIPSEIISQTNKIYLKFVSDEVKAFNGFSIEWDSTTIGCGGTLNAAYGDIISPNYPEPYMTQADCTWKIAVAEGNMVQLLIVDLQLEQQTKCRFDYIEISEGINHRNSERYCGTPYPQTISMNSNVVNIRFRSDFTNSGRGFHLKYETLCQNKVHGFYGVIESPNFPNLYMHNSNCSWTIDAPEGNKINLTFSHFDLENMSKQGCSYDYVEVWEGMEDNPQDLLKKICSTTEILPKIHSTKSQVFVKFITDAIFAYRGFRLEWVVDGCGGHLTKPADSFTSPGYPSSYPTDIECEWLIEVDYTHSIELTIHDINTEKQKGCFYDWLQIYSGTSDKAPMLIKLCYSPKPLVYTSSGNAMFLKFHSDSLYALRGFNISYKSVPITCGGRYTADSGIIFSANYPKNYPNKQNCNWLIQVDHSYVVNVTFQDFDIENSKNCTDDYVQIYDGPTKDSRLLGTHCRNELPPSYVSTTNEMLIVMRSDSMLSAKGFKARYHKACGARIVVENEGFIVPTPSFTDHTDLNANCTWILVAKNPADHVTVTFTHMEIYRYWDEDCAFDYIQILEGEGMDGPSRGRWCEDVIPLPVTSTGNALTVHLTATLDFIEHVSFTYSVLNSACGGTYTSYKGTIASPNYPNSYPLNSECIWILKNSPGNRIKLTFAEFDLQQSENCDLDYLEIREDSGIGKLISISCGTNIDDVQTSKSLWIKFKSDGDDVGKGFVGEFSLEGGDELTGPMGRITSPLYPMPFRKRTTIFWRITVDFGWLIRIEITDLFVESLDYVCYPYLRIYDGYDNEAPLILNACGLNIPEPLTSATNVVYIELSTDSIRHDSWFDLNWLQIPRDTDLYSGNVVIQLPECNQEVALMDSQNSSYDFSSPGWPDGYQDNLRCSWIFTSPPGTHLVMRILSMDLEESTNCVADFVEVYSGNAVTSPDNAELLQKLCLANSTSTKLAASNVMTVKFETDSYLNKTGFNAFVYRDCGGKLEGPNGVIEINNATSIRGKRFWQVQCEWVIEVKPGRTIQVQITKMSIQQGPSWTCTNNYLMLKNGGDMSSPLLGVGKYCGNVTPKALETTGNRLYVKAFGVRSNVNFELTYRQVSTKCGGEFILSSHNKQWEISTPNYPNIPHPYTECTWTAMAPGRERISIHFVERFDLSYTLNCEKEYVEVRDGGTDSSKSMGRYCKDVAPNSMISTGNMLFVYFYTDIPEPKNGFKAVLTIEDICGGIVRGVNGIISSPNYPFFYPRNQTCIWHVIAPTDHTLKFSFLDMHLPGYRYCKNTDYLEIIEMTPTNDTNKLGTYCGMTVPEPVETASNEAVVIFNTDHFAYTTYRGFSMNYSASREVCGGEFTAMQGTIKSNGYPNIATYSKFCDWRIKLPKGYQVVVDIQDMDIMSRTAETRIGYSLSFYNDFHFRSRIKLVEQNTTEQQVKSSDNTMMIIYYSKPGYRGFKLRYYGVAPAPCGGVLTQVSGNLTGPKYRPLNESSYFCQWDIEAPQSLTNNDNDTGLTLSIMVTGTIGAFRGYSYSKYCYNYQYISLIGNGMICGNFSEPTYLRSPKHSNKLTIVNGTFAKPMQFQLEYKWQPCGGILQGLSHVISAPRNISFPINCVWHANYPDNGEMIKFHLNKLHMGGCDRNYLSIRDGGRLSPQIVKFCGHMEPYNITSTSNELWIEYMTDEETSDFEFTLEPANNGCGGALRGSNREISSPKFPSQYPNNAECTWEITADNGYHIGLEFVDRFNLESSPNCEKDYVQIFQWIKGANETAAAEWKELGKICGRNTPQPFNTTGNRMKVIFHSNEAVQGDGFRAMWYQNCGGVFNVTSHHNVIVSPSYPNFYKPNLVCNYTLVAPQEKFIVQFVEFQVEQGRKDCRFDNVTIKYTERYNEEEKVWCGENKPPILMSRDRAEIIFKTDRYIQRSGFLFKYYLNGCGGLITEPTEISPLMNNEEYFGGHTCSWEIRAPLDKNVVLRFETFELEDSYRCMYDKVTVYDGAPVLEENKLATLCGNLTGNMPIFKSNSSSMVVEFMADESFSFKGFSAKVLFVKNVEAGCGGFVNLTDVPKQSFRTQKGSTYDSLEDCHWRVIAPEGKNIKFTINSMDIKNAMNGNGSKCTGDYIEVRDGSGPLAELIGRYCGNEPPLAILSGSNTLWIRFFSDGTLEGTGAIGTFDIVDALCSLAPPLVNGTKLILTSPNYPFMYQPGSRCRWILSYIDSSAEKLKIRFLNMDIAESDTCDTDFVQITDTQNRKYIEEGFGENFVWNGQNKDIYSSTNDFSSSTAYKYCGNTLPHDYYSHSEKVEVLFKGFSSGHRGFKLEYSKAACNWNFTAEQGRIMHSGIDDCLFTITAPDNYTISLYFNELTLYDSTECTHTSLRVFEGGFDGKLLATICSMDVPSPIFSTGNKLSLHSVSEWHSNYETYDITYTTTSEGRGCGGRIYNYAGSFTSPMYPNEYRENIVCSWDISVPRGLKIRLEFPVFDIGSKETCNYIYNIVQIYEATPGGEEIYTATFCGGDDLAPYVSTNNRLIVKYVSSVNNVGTGWRALFKAQES